MDTVPPAELMFQSPMSLVVHRRPATEKGAFNSACHRACGEVEMALTQGATWRPLSGTGSAGEGEKFSGKLVDAHYREEFKQQGWRITREEQGFLWAERDGMYINLYAAEGRTYFILEEL